MFYGSKAALPARITELTKGLVYHSTWAQLQRQQQSERFVGKCPSIPAPLQFHWLHLRLEKGGPTVSYAHL